MKLLSIILLLMICWNSIIYQIIGINTENSVTDACSSDSDCVNSTNTDISSINSTENMNYIDEFNNNAEWNVNDNNIHTTENINGTTTTIIPLLIETPITIQLHNINESMIKNFSSNLNTIVKNNADICTCDLTILQCDINCCCDNDCNEFHLSIFSHCTDRQTKKYDNRYCYTNNFVQRNNTEFILERLSDNLFCITYDNLPPIYSKSNAIKIKNRKQFDDIMIKNMKKLYTWTNNQLFIPLSLNTSIPYRNNDVIWKIQLNSIKLIEFPMSGFTSQCTFRKKLEYLKDFNSQCLQKNLSNDNFDLFTGIYNNFTVISSPIFFNSSYISLSMIQNCPKNICIPIESKYCMNSSSLCNTTKPHNASCVNGSCKNIVKKVNYIITHNGTMGIKKIQLSIELGNVSESFYQYFNVQYKWAEINEEINYHHRSGNPGYHIGKPIIIGALKLNTTDNIVIIDGNSNNTNYFLTVPLALKNGNCYENNRYIINVGDDVKLNCRVTLKTNNFSLDSCSQLHEKILTIFFGQSLVNVTDIQHYKIYVSKLGNITNNNVTNWNQILLNKMPNQILKSQNNNGEISCSGLTTILSIDILYSLLPKPDNIDNYKIIGIGMTLSERENINWPKCISINCTDTLDINLITYVKFHDISTPETYYYAGGPNLDISLPYDFFYPFLSGNSIRNESNLFIFIILIIFIHMYI